MEHFFSPNSGGDLRSDAHQSQIIGGDADVDHTQIIGGDTVKLLGDISPPSPPGFGTPGHNAIKTNAKYYKDKGFTLLSLYLRQWRQRDTNSFLLSMLVSSAIAMSIVVSSNG